MSAWRYIFLIAFAGCAQTIVLENPRLGDSPSLLVMIFDQSGPHVVAMDRSEPFGLVILGEDDVRRSENFDLAVLEMRCPLHVFGLQPGSIRLEDASAIKTYMEPKRAHLLSVRDGQAGDWVEVQFSSDLVEIHETLSRLRLPSTCSLHTAKLDTMSLVLPGNSSTNFVSSVTFALQTGDGEAIVGLSSGDLLSVSKTGAINRHFPGHVFVGGYRAFDGSLWFADENGQLWRDSGDGLQPITEAFGSYRRMRLAGPTDIIAPFELFAVTDLGELFHYRDDALNRLAPARSSRPPGSPFIPSLAWIAENEVVTINIGENAPDEVLHWRDAVSTGQRIVKTTAVANVPGFGPVLGTENGELSFLKDDAWGAPEKILSNPIVGFAGIGPNMLVCSDDVARSKNVCHLYVPGLGACRTEIEDPGRFAELVPLDDRTLLLLTSPIEDSRLTMIEHSGDLDPCLKD